MGPLIILLVVMGFYIIYAVCNEAASLSKEIRDLRQVADKRLADMDGLGNELHEGLCEQDQPPDRRSEVAKRI
jgi:hypothetical protein